MPRKAAWLIAILAAGIGTAAQPVPGEIDLFWGRTRQQLAREPMEMKEEPLRERLPYEKIRITYRGLGGVPVRAYLAKPIRGESAVRRLPAIITAPGYGGWEQGVELAECQRGYIVLQVFPRSQGESADLWRIDGPDKLTWRLNKPEGAYYQGAYADMLRGVDYLASRADVDALRIGVMGTSQGGGIALALASLDPRLKAVVAHVPFLCDMRRAAQIDGALVRTLLLQHRSLTESRLNSLDYFDPLNLVHHLAAPALVSAGGKDTTCPAATIRAVFDRIAGIKALAYYPDLPHTSSGDFYELSWNWMDRHLRH